MFERIKDILGLRTVPNEKLRIKRERISWDHIFLYEALLWSLRSHDAQTQCGCVLTSPDNTILSTGYNGFIRDIDDEALFNVRPFKYDFMIHAEHNAILNCARNGKSTIGATAYITGQPCNWCLQYMWNVGINRIIYSDFNDIVMLKNDGFRKIRQVLLELMNPIDERIEMKFIPSSELNLQQIVDIFNRQKGKKRI